MEIKIQKNTQKKDFFLITYFEFKVSEKDKTVLNCSSNSRLLPHICPGLWFGG